MEKTYFALIDNGEFKGATPFVSHLSDSRIRLKNLMSNGIGNFIIQINQSEYDYISKCPQELDVFFIENNKGIERFTY